VKRRATSAVVKQSGVARSKLPKQASMLELIFLSQCRAAGIQEPAREVTFHPTRKWRLDFGFVHPKSAGRLIALEIEGGAYSGGRHTRGAGFTTDIEKYNEAALLGWTIFRATGEQVKNGQALQWIERALS
jgi:hypothetical protein